MQWKVKFTVNQFREKKSISNKNKCTSVRSKIAKPWRREQSCSHKPFDKQMFLSKLSLLHENMMKTAKDKVKFLVIL